MNNPMELQNKHIVITGASSGLGRETCIYISRHGAKVSLVARNKEALLETISLMDGDNHMYYPFDLCEVDGIEELIKRIVEENGKIDGLVHAAGIGTSKPLSMTKFDFMLDMMKVHLFSFVELVRVISKKKNSYDSASMIAISSAGTFSSDKGKVAYCASKGALDSVIRAMAVELGESRAFRVNTINPGWVKTRMYETGVEVLGVDQVEKQISYHILGALEPVDIAYLIAYLLSDMSKKITGQNIIIDSGWTIH